MRILNKSGIQSPVHRTRWFDSPIDWQLRLPNKGCMLSNNFALFRSCWPFEYQLAPLSPDVVCLKTTMAAWWYAVNPIQTFPLLNVRRHPGNLITLMTIWRMNRYSGRYKTCRFFCAQSVQSSSSTVPEQLCYWLKKWLRVLLLSVLSLACLFKLTCKLAVFAENC